MKKTVLAWILVLCMLFGSTESVYAQDQKTAAACVIAEASYCNPEEMSDCEETAAADKETEDAEFKVSETPENTDPEASENASAAAAEDGQPDITDDEQAEAAEYEYSSTESTEPEAADDTQYESADDGQTEAAEYEDDSFTEDAEPETADDAQTEAADDEQTEAALSEDDSSTEAAETEAADSAQSETSDNEQAEAAELDVSSTEDTEPETAGDAQAESPDEKDSDITDDRQKESADDSKKEKTKKDKKEGTETAADSGTKVCAHTFDDDGFCTICGQFVFEDVSTETTAVKYVSWAYKNGIVTGTSSTTFSPKASCTRIQFVMMLWKMMGSKEVTGVDNPFSDVTGSKSVKAVKWALNERIINSGTTFDSNGTLTRIQIVMILWKLAGSPRLAGDIPFTDVSGSKTTQAVLWAYTNGITKGTTDTAFSPDSVCTRLQLVTFLYKYSQLPAPEETGILTAADTGISHEVYAVGEYGNWDGVSNVSQFTDNDGNYCFAVDKGTSETNVTVYVTKNGRIKKKISLKKKHPIFGAVTCDGSGNYFMVTGVENEDTDTDTKTVFISKYDSSGTLLKTVGNNGSSSLASYFGTRFYTKYPFYAGNCKVTVSGNCLSVHYARQMYSGHQSNSAWIINTDTMKTVTPSCDYPGFVIYSSHSFAQRVIPFGSGFAYLSEGDCFNRAFTLDVVDVSNDTQTTADLFHFWVPENTYTNWNMYALNNNFAHLGDISDIGGGLISHVSSSVKALNEAAADQSEQIFIQILDPTKKLSSASGYITSGKRSGVSGPDGDEAVTDYGVKWLTDYSTDYYISETQAVSDGIGNTYILYELYQNSMYKGIYYLKVDVTGSVTAKKKCISQTAYLNPCETPVYCNGTVCWTSNSTESSNMFIYRLKV